MRIAWFRDTAPDADDPLDDRAPLIDELRRSHDIDVIVERNAHDFVWQHRLRPWNVCVYELDSTPAHEFVWAYLVNYPGVVMLRSLDLAYLRVALHASRAVVTSTPASAETLRTRYPEAHVRAAPVGIAPLPHVEARREGPVRLAVFDGRGPDLVERALRRAGDAGAVFETVRPDARASMIAECDVVISPDWPPSSNAPTAVLAGMAAGKAVVTMEMDTTATWPAIDPQTWRPRGMSIAAPPIAVTVDPRDEEHSLMLAVRRLSSDPALREQLGKAGHAWWMNHATVAHAAAAWERILEEADALVPPSRPDNWPAQFTEDGTELARKILNEFGLAPSDIRAQS